jgi:hypothetical protein
MNTRIVMLSVLISIPDCEVLAEIINYQISPLFFVNA